MNPVNSLAFVECAICGAKPGSPDLCESCLHNRHAIAVLEEMIERLEADVSLLIKYLPPYDSDELRQLAELIDPLERTMKE